MNAISNTMDSPNAIVRYISKDLLIYDKMTLSACACDEHGAVDDSCSETGKCTCKDHFTGDKCDECVKTFFGFPNCEGIV